MQGVLLRKKAFGLWLPAAYLLAALLRPGVAMAEVSLDDLLAAPAPEESKPAPPAPAPAPAPPSTEAAAPAQPAAADQQAPPPAGDAQAATPPAAGQEPVATDAAGASLDSLLIQTLAEEAAAAGPAETPKYLDDAWLKLRNALDSRQYSVVTTELSNLNLLRVRLGIANLPTYSNALLELAEDARSKSDTELAARLVQSARTISPGLPGPEFTQANLNQGDVGPFLLDWINAYQQALGRFPVSLAARGYLYLSMALAILALAGVFGLTLLYRHLVPLAHDAGTALRMEKTPAWPVRVGTLLVLCLPLAAGWAGLGAAALWIVVFFPYASKAEQVASPFILLSLLAVTPLAQRAGFLLDASQSPAVIEVSHALDAKWGPESISALRKTAEGSSKDEASRFALAFILSREGSPEEARAAWDEVLKINSGRWQAFNNLAVDYLRGGDAPEAQSQLQRGLSAAKDSRESAVLLYNLSLAREAQGQQAEAQDALRRARALSPAEVEDWERAGRGLPAWRRPVFAALSPGEFGPLLAPLLAASPTAPSSLADALGTGKGPGPTAFLGLCLAALAVLAFLGKRFQPASSCDRCGVAISGKAGATAQARTICPQCIAAFFRKTQVDPESRIRKVAEVERYQRRRRWFLRAVSFLVPGAAWFGRGKPGIGLLLTGMVVLLGTGSLLAVASSPAADPYLLAPVARWPLWLVSGPICLAAYLAGTIQSFRSGR